eukprot:TRINITY_DN75686_c0_g1_i1.p1 TRINITY_DN75686_c0_g1~~TRINITY_DN75686_c0_g1_i1.p1  ORF type:complete len:594 (-),score=90.46 TRINITY_DN75686_c0_g1_i1:76-1857(-)
MVGSLLVAFLSAAITPSCDALESGYAVSSATSGKLRWVSLSGASAAPSDALAYGRYADGISTEGFGSLLVETLTEAEDDGLLFESMGFVEGYLTAERTVQHVHNILPPAAPEVEDFVLEHIVYLRTQVDRYGGSDPYWKVVGFLLEKQRGFASGMRLRLAELQPESLSAESPRRPLAAQEVRLLGLSDTMLQAELMRLNLVEDIDEIATALNQSRRGNISVTTARIAQKARAGAGKYGHCSALIKVAGPRVLFGHNTWTTYDHMLRIWKDYAFLHVKMEGLVSRRVSMASQPGFFASMDDWLVMRDTQMVVLETTLDDYDPSKLAKYISPASVSTMMRSMIASLLAANPREWYETFSRENSASYNNQWMIFSSKAWAAASAAGFQPSRTRDVFWVFEQQPGQIVGTDMTKTLLEVGYWKSYNVPYFNQTLGKSNYYENRDKLVVCEDQRGALLQELQGQVKTLTDLQKGLRTNTWRSSRLSWTCPKCAVASRFDLRGANKTNGCFDSASDFYGAIDAKVTDDLMVTRGESLFVSGPPNIEVPPFSWETAASTTPSAHMLSHVGHDNGPMDYPWRLVGGDNDPVNRGQSITLFM